MSIDHDFVEGAAAVRRLLGPKWSPHVMIALGDGRKRYNEIKESINQRLDGRDCLHTKVLTDTLRDMEAHGLVHRFENADVFPPAVTYELTPGAYELMAAIGPAASAARELP
ncbi:winged helix-turn-helix transcriptional regulator [Kutzneria sp. NPDC052558]|uniref:winged helix-turn-helix transcriptional regulator n=1 Tax=Kutzneria sp. NPDC052558 TaxID=3364121 RepID=UPI0037C6D2A3